MARARRQLKKVHPNIEKLGFVGVGFFWGVLVAAFILTGYATHACPV